MHTIDRIGPELYRDPKFMLGVVLLSGVAALHVTADADLWWHLLAGQTMLEQGSVVRIDHWSYTASGQPWINHEWLTEILFAAFWNFAGETGLLVVRALAILTLLGAWVGTVYRRLPIIGLTLALIALTWPYLATLINLRPNIVTLTLVPLSLALVDGIEAGSRKSVWLLVVVVCLWANMHGGFLFGWGIAGLGLLLALLGITATPTRAQRREWLVALAILSFTPLFTPYGLEYPLYIVRELSASHPYLPEWNPPVPVVRAILIAATAVPFGLWALSRSRVRPVAWIALIVSFLAALHAARFVALVLLLAPVCAADPLAALLKDARKHSADGLRILNGNLLYGSALAFATMMVVLLNPGRLLHISVNPTIYPAQAVRFLEASKSSGRLLTPLGWGGIALYHLYPNYRVSLDGRNTTVYPVHRVIRDVTAWRDGTPTALVAERPDAALVRTGLAMDKALRARGWLAAHVDATASVLTPPQRQLGGPGLPANDDFTRFP